MGSLYEYTNKYLYIKQTLDHTEDESFIDTLEALEDAIEVKVENIARFVKELDYEEEIIKKEIQRLKSRLESTENKKNRLKQYVHESLEKVNMKKVKTPLFTLNIQKNPDSVKEVNPLLIPHELYNSETSNLDRREVLNRIKDCEEIIGVEIIQSESLRIR